MASASAKRGRIAAPMTYRDTWEHIGSFGPMVMPLNEALKHVAKDPTGGKIMVLLTRLVR